MFTVIILGQLQYQPCFSGIADFGRSPFECDLRLSLEPSGEAKSLAAQPRDGNGCAAAVDGDRAYPKRGCAWSLIILIDRKSVV